MKGIAKKVLDRLDARESTKKARTLFLNDENYKRLVRICKVRECKPSQVVDELIAVFLEQVEGE